MNILSKEQILKMHASLIEATGTGTLSEHSGKGSTALFWIGKKSCNAGRKQKAWCACYVCEKKILYGGRELTLQMSQVLSIDMVYEIVCKYLMTQELHEGYSWKELDI